MKLGFPPNVNMEELSIGYPPIADGLYDAVLTAVTHKTPDDLEKSPYLRFEFTLRSSDAKVNGRKVWYSRWLPKSLTDEKAEAKLSFLAQALKALGIPLDKGIPDTETWINSVCRLQIAQRTRDDGEIDNEVKKIIAA